MKKVLAGLFLSFVLVFSLGSQITLINTAQAAQCDGGLVPLNGGPLCVPPNQFGQSGFTGVTTVGGFIFKLIQILLILSAVVAILFLVIGGFRYMTSSGNQEAADKGKKMITNAIIGLIVVILSYTIVTVVVNTVTKGDVIGSGGSSSGGGSGGGTVPCTLPDGSPCR